MFYVAVLFFYCLAWWAVLCERVRMVGFFSRSVVVALAEGTLCGLWYNRVLLGRGRGCVPCGVCGAGDCLGWFWRNVLVRIGRMLLWSLVSCCYLLVDAVLWLDWIVGCGGWRLWLLVRGGDSFS